MDSGEINEHPSVPVLKGHLRSLAFAAASRARGCDVPVVLTTDQRDSVIIDANDEHTIWLQRPFDVRRLLDALDEATGVRPVATAR